MVQLLDLQATLRAEHKNIVEVASRLDAKCSELTTANAKLRAEHACSSDANLQMHQQMA